MKLVMPLKNNTAIIKEAGRVISYYDGVAKLVGLPRVLLYEVLTTEVGRPVAMVIGFDESAVDVIFFEKDFELDQRLFRSHQIFSIPESENYDGRIINGLGQPIDGGGELIGSLRSVFRAAPPIIDREPVNEPLSTGVKIIDTTLPLGRGQRELIIGDRKLGKSTLAIDTVLNQKNNEKPVYCIYVLCGQKRRQLEELVSILKQHSAFNYSVVVAATADDSLANQYLAPFVGCAIGEYWRDQGHDALVVYDDLSKHAKTYRAISLLLSRAPGREAYPGDIFSIHAGLLERAARLAKAKGGGSLTALPIIETLEGDITSFIATNIISITDGQIYLERGLYQKGFLPAVNVGLSVSRVGSQAQPKPLKEVVSGIRLALSQYKELQKLTQLETVVGKQAQQKIHRGELILELLKQSKHDNVTWPEQVVLFYIVESGHFDDLKKESWSQFELLLRQLIKGRYYGILQKIEHEGLNDNTKAKLNEIVSEFKNEFIS